MLAEAHARPFRVVPIPCRFFHFAFVADTGAADKPMLALGALCKNYHKTVPSANAKHFYLQLGSVGLRFEQHTEFTTYTWEFKEGGSYAEALAWMSQLQPVGSHFVSVDLELSREGDESQLEKEFEAASLALSRMDDDAALAATDFRANEHGFVRFHVVNRQLSAIGAGALVQRLLELETYRMLCLLGLFEAQRVAPMVCRSEQSLSRLITGIREDTAHSKNEAALNELVNLSAELEADGMRSQYRFAASKAYHEIVQGRVAAIAEKRCGSYPTFASFLSRRLDPAMRTCLTMETRQTELAGKLTRTAELVRTRVNCEIERQSRDLLISMNERTQSQFRLQRAVERLSIVAISYYVVALLSYAFSGLEKIGVGRNPAVETAISIPIVLFTVWTLLASLQRRANIER